MGGTNPWIRGTAGFCSGYFIGNIASEGVLFWYQSLGMSIGLGALWAAATLYNSEWGTIARENKFVIEMYSRGLHKSVVKHNKAKETVKELYAKDIQQKAEIYEELLQMQQAENGGDINVDEV